MAPPRWAMLDWTESEADLNQTNKYLCILPTKSAVNPEAAAP